MDRRLILLALLSLSVSCAKKLNGTATDNPSLGIESSTSVLNYKATTLTGTALRINFPSGTAVTEITVTLNSNPQMGQVVHGTQVLNHGDSFSAVDLNQVKFVPYPVVCSANQGYNCGINETIDFTIQKGTESVPFSVTFVNMAPVVNMTNSSFCETPGPDCNKDGYIDQYMDNNIFMMDASDPESQPLTVQIVQTAVQPHYGRIRYQTAPGQFVEPYSTKFPLSDIQNWKFHYVLLDDNCDLFPQLSDSFMVNVSDGVVTVQNVAVNAAVYLNRATQIHDPSISQCTY